MKKIILTLLALVLTGTGAFAQGFGQFDPAEMAKMRVDHMKETYKLSDEQSKKLLDFFTADGKKMAEEMEKGQQGGFDMESFQKRMKATNDTIKKVLTEEQFKAYDADMKKMREQMQGGGGFGGGF